MGSFFNLHWWITQTPKARATRFWKSWCSETSFLMFWEDKLCSVFMPIFMFTTFHTSTPTSGVHYRLEIIAGLFWDTKRVKMAEKPQKNSKELCWKRLVEQRKHCLSLARKSFKMRENIKRKWEARNICWKQEVSSQNGRVGISLEFHCKNFFLLKSVCTWYVFLKSPYTP